jgi:Domain of unknown function (DUF4387)
MKLVELASTIRSKNAGVDHITFDIICRDRENFDRVKNSGALTKQSVAQLYRVSEDRIASFVVFEPAQAIKFTIRREMPSGCQGETDMFGSQQYALLFDLEIS